MATCLYIGRFQPIHIGHLDVINQIFDHGYQRMLIGVGSSNITDSDRNPRTYPERKNMILSACRDRGIDQNRIEIVGIPDFSEDEDWVSYIMETYMFDTVMSGNQWVIDIFSSHDIDMLPELERISIHATDIRSMIGRSERDEIRKRVTPSVYAKLYEGRDRKIAL